MLHDVLTSAIIGAFFDVHHELGHGFLESVYERALVIALSRRGLQAEHQVAVQVHYDGQIVGDFYADLIVDRRVIVEIKACRVLHQIHEAQLLNYLRASSMEVGLLLHFAHKPVFRRLILTNDRKPASCLRGLPRPSVVKTSLPA